MSSLGLNQTTKTRFDRLKKTVAASMSADEFLTVLLDVYERRQKELEVAAK